MRSRVARAAAVAVAGLLLASACAGGATAARSTGSGAASVGPASPVTSSSSGPSTTPTANSSPTSELPTSELPSSELPRGGRTIFPRYRLVGYAGGANSPAFGRLGTGDINERGREIAQRAKALAGGREPLPVFELIAVVAQSSPGSDGDYNARVSDAVVAKYLAAARRQKGLLLLNIQPGREDFLPLVKGFEKYLKAPDVGIALDPEWAVAAGDVPGEQYGSTTGSELDSVAAYLDTLVSANNLPQKAMVFHQVAASVVRGQGAVRSRNGVVVIKSIDGIGSPGAKLATWTRLVANLPPSIHTGVKLFFAEDVRRGPLMTPKQILALRPQPEYVLYE